MIDLNEIIDDKTIRKYLKENNESTLDMLKEAILDVLILNDTLKKLCASPNELKIALKRKMGDEELRELLEYIYSNINKYNIIAHEVISEKYKSS